MEIFGEDLFLFPRSFPVQTDQRKPHKHALTDFMGAVSGGHSAKLIPLEKSCEAEISTYCGDNCLTV